MCGMSTEQEDAPVGVVGAAIVDDLTSPARRLAAGRTEPPAVAGGGELPGGRVDAGGSTVEALRREVAEELGVEIALGEVVEGPLGRGRWPLGAGYAMTVHLAVVTAGSP